MSDNRLRIVIVGGGVAAWMAAAALARALRRRANSVRLIELGDDPADFASLGAPEASLPPICMLHAILGIDEDEFIRRTNATFKLGVEFHDWAAPGRVYFHPYGEFGAGMESVAFHHYWLKMRALGEAAHLEDYSLAAAAAKIGRFARPVGDPSSVLSTLAYAFHLDSGLYARFLRDYAIKRGVAASAGEIADVRLRGEDGFIDAIVLKSGERVEGDLFIDCTGSRALLIEQALKVGFEDWTHWLPCDRIVAASSAVSNDPFPITRATAHAAGWAQRIPLQNCVGASVVYCSENLSDDADAAQLLSAMDGPALGEPRFARFKSGRRRKVWTKNCVAIGAAAGCLEPLESTNLHFIQSGVSRLAGLLPDRSCAGGVAEEYDRLVSTGLERIRDLLILHYKATERDDSEFWRRCRDMSVPDALAYKMKVFAARGRVVLTDEETFQAPSWISAFIGQGVLPRRYDPLADMVDDEIVRNSLRRMREAIREAANSMPAHRAYLAKICAAAPMLEARTSGARR